MSQTNWTYAQSFCASFQSSSSDIQARLEAALTRSQAQAQTTPSSSISKDEMEMLTRDIVELSKSFGDAAGSLPSYDQKRCASQLKVLEKMVQDLHVSTMPKPKFAFQRKVGSKPTQSSSSSASSEQPIQAKTTPNTIPTTTMPNISSSTNMTLLSSSNQYLTLDSLPARSSARPSDLTISNLDNCIVNLLPSPAHGNDNSSNKHQLIISALHIRDVTDTVLLLPIIQGSVILHSLKRCIVVVGCHQFRMHRSENIDIYLLIQSNPIIEHSAAVRFAAYPMSLSGTQSVSNYSSVQDFSHIRPTQSPNWSIMPDGARSTDWLGLALRRDSDIEKLLNELLPSVS